MNGTTQTIPGCTGAATVGPAVASLATNQTILALNANRRGAILYNSDANALLLKYGATASATSYTYRILSGQTWEMPNPIYVGQIDGLWEADGSGSAFITELTI